MKKIVFFAILTIIGVIKVSAQQVDILQENYADTRIEELTQEVAELSERLDKLQEDYNFLSFEKFVKEFVFRTEIFYTDLKISISSTTKYVRIHIMFLATQISYFGEYSRNLHINQNIAAAKTAPISKISNVILPFSIIQKTSNKMYILCSPFDLF